MMQHIAMEAGSDDSACGAARKPARSRFPWELNVILLSIEHCVPAEGICSEVELWIAAGGWSFPALSGLAGQRIFDPSGSQILA